MIPEHRGRVTRAGTNKKTRVFPNSMKEKYEASVTGATETTWTADVNDETLPVSVPASFGGAGEGTTPEHLFAASLLNCYVATFRVIAKKSNLDIERLDADITIDLDTDNDTPIPSAHIEVISKPESSKTKHVANKAKEHCYIHRSAHTDITVTLNDEEI